MTALHRLKLLWLKKTEQPKLSTALALAVCVALAMMTTGVVIYYSAGFYKFDLSRPGYEKEREQVTNDTNEVHKNYDTTSPVTAEALTKFLTDFDASTQKAAGYGDFRDQSLSDTELGLTQ